MPTADSFGSTWSFSVALSHVERVELREHARSVHRAISGKENPGHDTPELMPQSARIARRRAADGLLMALRDGYIRSTGRLSTTPQIFPDPGNGRAWRLHSSDPSLITTTEWREGHLDFSCCELTGPSWQYIQIEMPDFMVKAIWSDDIPEPVDRAQDAVDPIYTTPYLELMQDAIKHFGLTALRQEKKEVLSDWFRTQQIAGVPISNNLADSMATLIRLPSAQRGGAKRAMGPDLRRTD